MREVVLLDVTAMAGDAVCIAGVDRKTGEQLRLNDPQPTRAMVRRLGGLAPGDVLSIDWKAVRRPDPPHTEDGEWKLRSLKRLGHLDHAALTVLLSGSAFNSLGDAFGEAAFKGRNRNSAWRVRAGTRSLATLAVRYVRVEEDQDGRVRIAFKDAAGAYWGGVPFQDLSVRMHQDGCDDCAKAFLARVQAEFTVNRSLIRVGLTRPFAPEGHETACWLQVTNIFARPREHF